MNQREGVVKGIIPRKNAPILGQTILDGLPEKAEYRQLKRSREKGNGSTLLADPFSPFLPIFPFSLLLSAWFVFTSLAMRAVVNYAAHVDICNM